MDGEEGGLELEELPRTDVRSGGTALERVRQVSVALSDAARRKRVSSRRGAFATRRGARLARWLFIGSFVVLVAVPSISVAIYYYAFASDQYVAEAQFTVAVNQPPAIDDAVGSATGLPLLMIVQDTQVVASYIHSRAALDKLDQVAHVRDVYADPHADRFARFDSKKPIERFLKYWAKMSEAPIEMPGGVVHFKVRAFSPEAARNIAVATVEICEQLVNDMNARMNTDALAAAEQELNRASKRVASTLAALETERNKSGILETTKTTETIDALLKNTQLNLLELQGQYNSHLKDLSPSAPEMQQLSQRIDVTRKQVADIGAKLTSNGGSGPSALLGDSTIAQAMTKLGQLDLERKVAEEVYTTATKELEVARVTAENKMMYLKTFVSPTVPQEALYPKRGLWVFIVFVGSLAIWALTCVLASTFRNHMA